MTSRDTLGPIPAHISFYYKLFQGKHVSNLDTEPKDNASDSCQSVVNQPFEIRKIRITQWYDDDGCSYFYFVWVAFLIVLSCLKK